MGDVEIYFLLGRDNYPDIEPYYVTERVTHWRAQPITP